jgi:hypothetical protein
VVIAIGYSPIPVAIRFDTSAQDDLEDTTVVDWDGLNVAQMVKVP